MDLVRHCEYALAVVDEGTFTDAAIALGMTQPPLSQGVRRLEARWGVRLFDRSARSVELTAAGRRLVPMMRALVAEARTLDQRARDLRAEAGDRVCGVDPALGPFTEAVLARWYAATGTAIRPRAGAPDQLVAAVLEGTADVALVQHPCAVDGVLSAPPLVLPTQLLLPPGTEADRCGVPVELPLALRPRAEAPAAHDLVVHTARRVGHNGEVLEVDTDPRAWVSAGAAWALAPDPEGTGRPAPRPLHLRAVVVARDPDVLQEVRTVAEQVAAPHTS